MSRRRNIADVDIRRTGTDPSRGRKSTAQEKSAMSLTLKDAVLTASRNDIFCEPMTMSSSSEPAEAFTETKYESKVITPMKRRTCSDDLVLGLVLSLFDSVYELIY